MMGDLLGYGFFVRELWRWVNDMDVSGDNETISWMRRSEEGMKVKG